MTNNVEWITVNKKKDKIMEPCWFYNNGGCRHKDGKPKNENECKYLHVLNDNTKKPVHLEKKKPCDKYNLEGDCKWYENCKYSHQDLTPREWSQYYPDIPYSLHLNIYKRLAIENKIKDIESRISILEYKQSGIIKDLKQLEYTLLQFMRTTTF